MFKVTYYEHLYGKRIHLYEDTFNEWPDIQKALDNAPRGTKEFDLHQIVDGEPLLCLTVVIN